MLERTGLVKFGGKDVTVVGDDVKVGQQAPEFHAHSLTWEWQPMLETTKGKVRIISAVLSLETSVCDRETRRFNEEAASLSQDIAIIVVSADLPYTQKRWCGGAGIDQVMVVSDHREMEFGVKYGCLLKEPRILRRAVFVVDRSDKVVYAAYMAALGDEPDYETVLASARNALKG
ncbi:MAG TPA: thiol peroxidase [Anaerolinea sp.]|nr:thiol peroxidase [Anaerolinea sp.]